MSRLEMCTRDVPDALTVLGGVHGTFMYRQVLSEAPWIDVLVRGIVFVDDSVVVSNTVEPLIEDLDSRTPDWDMLD